MTQAELREQIKEYVGSLDVEYDGSGQTTDQILSAVADWFLSLEEMQEEYHYLDYKGKKVMTLDQQHKNELRTGLRSHIEKLKVPSKV